MIEVLLVMMLWLRFHLRNKHKFKLVPPKIGNQIEDIKRLDIFESS